MYGPDVGGGQPKYAVVTGDDVVGSYGVQFAAGTTLARAEAQILRQEFPRDASYGRRHIETACVTISVLSKSVYRALQLDGKTYGVTVSFFSEGGKTLDPHSVTSSVILAGSASPDIPC